MAVEYTTCAIKVAEVLQSAQGAMQIWSDQSGALRELMPGLTEIKLPVGFMRATSAAAESGSIGTNVAGQPSFEDVGFSANWYHESAVQRELYRRGQCQALPNKDIWIYARLNLSDRSQDIILIPNTAPAEWGGAPNGGLDVAAFQIPSAATNAAVFFTVTGNMVQSARYIKASVNLEDLATDFAFTATTIDRAAGSFTDDGVEPGMKIYLDDTDLTPGLNFGRIVTVDTVTALQITIVETGYMEIDTASPTTWLRAGFQF